MNGSLFHIMQVNMVIYWPPGLLSKNNLSDLSFPLKLDINTVYSTVDDKIKLDISSYFHTNDIRILTPCVTF